MRREFGHGRGAHRGGGRTRGRLGILALVWLLSLGVTTAVALPAAAADAAMSITKAASASTVKPGQTFNYTIQVQCTTATASGCTNAEITDPLPAGILPNGTPTVAGGSGTATYDGTTLHVVFTDNLGGGAQGLAPGQAVTITVPVKVDPNLPYSDSGIDIDNTATITADNADPKDATATVVPNIPLNLDSTTTKDIQQPGDLPNPGTPANATVTGTNNSNAPVDQLVIADPVDPTAEPNPFTYLGLTSLGPVTMPDGAETVQTRVYVNGAWVDGPVGPPAALPAGVDPADVRGVQWVFTSTDDEGIPPGATASVGLDLAQTDAVVDAPKPLTVTNTADTTVSLGDQSATSDPASDDYRIPPADITIVATKSFDPDTVTAGDPSTVTLGATNDSELPLDSLTITEPQPGSPNPFEGGLTFSGWGTGHPATGDGIVWPQGATAAHVVYLCDGTAQPEQSTTTPNTLPDPPADCAVTGFTVTFDGPIAPGGEATIPFEVTTDPDQTIEEVSHPNTIGAQGAIGSVTGEDTASDTLVSIVDRLATQTDKRVSPSSIPSWPGQIATVLLTGQVLPFPDSTTDAHQIVVQDPDPISNDDPWFEAFRPQSVIATPVPADSYLTVQYWNGTEWVDVAGMEHIDGPTIVNQEFPQEVKDNAQGIRFVYTSTLPEPDGFPPGTTVAPNFTSELRADHAGSDAIIPNCAGTSASNGNVQSPESDPACDEVELRPPNPGSADPIDKHWDKDLLNARSQQQSGATLAWSTAGVTGLAQVAITDSAFPGTTPLDQSVFDVFDLVRIDPITATMDPYLKFDQIVSVELYRLAPGSTDPTDGAWTRAASDPCPAGCDGTFPGYTLSTDEQADTIGFRLIYRESPTRVQRISKPTDPQVGTGIAASTGNDRQVHPVFQLRDELRSNNDVPVTADRLYNVDGENGVIRNTVRGQGTFGTPGSTPFSYTDADDIALVDVPVTTHAAKSWSGGPLGIPEAGTAPEQYPTARVTISGQNTTPAKIDSLVITDPVGATDPFDSFNLVGFTAITEPESIGATDLAIVFSGDGTQPCPITTPCTRTQVMGYSEAELVAVTGIRLTYTGRIDIDATATATFDTRLRAEKRSGGSPTSGETITNTVNVIASDLDNYPNVTPHTAEDSDTATIDLVAQGLGVEAGKSFDPTSVTEPSHGPVTVTLTGQPSGPSRTVEMVLTDVAPTFWNAWDLSSLGDIAFTAPIDRVRVDALTGGNWSEVGGAPVLTGAAWTNGTATAGPTLSLPTGVNPADVQGLRFTLTKADDSNWENPANPKQSVTFQVTRRDELHTGGPVPSDLAGSTPAPGETVAGDTTNTIDAGVTSSDRDVDGNRLTAHDDATAVLQYKHANNAVQVRKVPDGDQVQPGQPFTYTLTATNTGDVDITNPVITDYLPTDAQGPMLEFPEDPGYTYAITNGTGMPVDPDRVTVTQTDSQITFTFPDGSTLPVGATYTITFSMQTRPGLPADTDFTNEFGITGSRPWDACDGTLDQVTGECKADATNSVASAGALGVAKQVKAEGSDVLGVIKDPLSESVKPCAPVADGYYNRPCVPVAEPGGDIGFRFHFTNTGNREIDRIVAVDRLPAPDDALATVPGLARESQWRPLLAGSRPELAHAPAGATLQVWYTTAAVDCTDPLGTDGESCPAVAWTEWPDGATLPVDADTVTGLKFVVEELSLDPAASLDIDLAMVAPAFSPASGADTIAFNTVGMSGRWIDGDTTGYTLTTEPPRVGVALATGPLQVEKRVTGDAAAQYAPDSYTATLSCTSVGQEVPLTDEQANLTLVPDEPVTIADLPYHSVCTVTEGDHGQQDPPTQSTTAVVQRELTDVETAVLTNVYNYASLAITKSVDTDAVDQDGHPVSYGPFTVETSCTFNGADVYAAGYGPDHPMIAELSDGEVIRYTDLPARAQCTITESDDKGALGTTIVTTAGTDDPTSTESTDATIELAPNGEGDGNTAAITNQFGVGDLRLVKKVTGEVAELYGAGPFTLHVSCVLDDESGTRTVYDADVTLGGSQPLTTTIDNLARGAACTVTEPDDGGATSSTIDPVDPVIVGESDGPVTVTATNSFDPGTLRLTKSVTGDAADFAPTSFQVEVTCAADGAVLPGFPQTVTVTAGELTEVDTLVGATCSAVETETGGATAVSYDPPGADRSGDVVVGAADQEPISIGVINQYRAGALQIVKDVTGPGAAIGPGPYEFSVVCAFNGDAAAYADTVTLTRAGDATTLTSAVIGPLPVGAVCTVTETDSGGADSTPPPVTVTIPDVDESGDPVVVPVGFVNPYSAGTLQITKVVTGDGAALAADTVFAVAATCQVQTADGARADVYHGSVQVKGGQTVPIAGADGKPALLPLGAHCWAEETDTGGATSSAVDHNSWDNAVVVEQSDELAMLTITVTNTFGAVPPPPPPPTPLPNTGAPILRTLLIAGLLLAGGAGLVLITRRRRRTT